LEADLAGPGLQLGVGGEQAQLVGLTQKLHKAGNTGKRGYWEFSGNTGRGGYWEFGLVLDINKAFNTD